MALKQWREANEEVARAWDLLMSATRSRAGSLRSFGVWRGRAFVDQSWHHGIVEEEPDGVAWALSHSEEWMARRRGQWCAQAPMVHHVGAIAPVEKDMKRAWQPAQVTHHGFLHGAEVVLGHVCLLECAVETPREPWRALREALIARQASMVPGTEVAHIMVSATGRKLSWSDTASAWLGEARWDDFEHTLRDWIDEPGASPMTRDAFGLRLVPMTHEQRQGHLVVIERPDPLELDWREGLTALQHQIATLASQSQTVAQIADATGVSENTIKYHLKNVYNRLHISTRTELMGVMNRL